MRGLIIGMLLVVAVPAAGGDWVVAPEGSRLGFLSVKNVDIAEAHRFTALGGAVRADGTVEVRIGLDSVDTAVPIRNERMREILFDTGRYPEAVISGRVDLGPIEALEVGRSLVAEVPFTLDFRGVASPLVATVEVTRIAEDALRVATVAPILLNASNLGVGDGVAKLQELAGLRSISLSVPTWFDLRLELAPADA